MDEELSSRLELDLRIEDPRFAEAIPDLTSWVRQAVVTALVEAISRPRAPVEVAVHLVDDRRIHALNAQHRGRDRPTDVLSFPTLQPEEVAPALAGQVPVVLGDVVVAFDSAARDAASAGRPLAAHLTHLLVHGTLHLLGYDHQREAEARCMEALERHILARLGLPDPYAHEVSS